MKTKQFVKRKIELSRRERNAVRAWLRDEVDYHELADALGVSHDAAPRTVATILRQWYQEKGTDFL